MTLDAQIAEWRAYMRRRQELDGSDADELEDHLRDRITELTGAGLHDDEAFLIAVKRMGSLDALSREFAREHSERLWKQLVLPAGSDEPTAARSRVELAVMISCAAVAGLAFKVPAAFGLSLDGHELFYARNFSFFALVPLAAYFAWRRRVGPRVGGVLALLFVVFAVAINAYPAGEDTQTAVVSVIHLPLALWLVVGIAYAGGDWRSSRRRMDFIRFSGEWLIYFALIALGGGALTGVTAGVFNAIGLDPEVFISEWLVPCGAMAAVTVSAWLVEAKQSVIENMAPVLTRVFTPLFAAALLVFLVAIAVTAHGIDVERDVLIIFDLLLVVVLALLLYAISARDPTAPPGLFDRLQLVLVVLALIIDAIVLAAITGRITEWGLTPNKAAALGENLVLLTNLAWSAWLFLGFVRRRSPFVRLDNWQTSYVAVYAGWVWFVVLVFPPVFGFA
jgi:hypothetical protein